MRGALAVLGQMAVAVVVAVLVAAVSLVAISRVEWPAYNSSNQLHALTTVGQFGCLAGLFVAGWLWRRGRRMASRAGALLFLSAFSVVTLAMPLGATKLYLFGISVDQQFRTEYLTRLTDTPALHDMTYIGLPPFYPPAGSGSAAGLAALTGTPGVGDVQAVGDHLDRDRGGARIRVVVQHDSLRVRAGGVDGDRGGDAGVLTGRAVRRDHHRAAAAGAGAGVVGLAGPDAAAAGRRVVGVGLFLGVAALFYTLLLGYVAFTLTVMARRARARPPQRSNRCCGWR